MSGAHLALVIDDEAALRNVLAQELTRAGYRTFVATDGFEGFELAMRERPDIVLLDICMPNDGITMLRKLRSDKSYGKHVPVILLTNTSPDAERILQAIEELEPSFYLIKADLTPTEIVEKVNETLSQHGAKQA
jgi:DNA-binding response OmpR family regulator